MTSIVSALSLVEPQLDSVAEFCYLDQSAVLSAGILDMQRAFDVIEEALILLELGKCVQPHKVVLRDQETVESESNGRFNALFASIKGSRPAVGMKWIASFPANRSQGLPRASAIIILNSPENGFPVAMMDGTLVSAMRTGAVTGLGARNLAPQNTRKVGMLGAGVQARTQILGLISALPQIEEIAVFNRCEQHAEALIEECTERWQAPVVKARNVAGALADADVALTITTASEPLMRAEHIKPGALTIQLSGHECEFDLLRRCQKLVVDNWEVIKHRGIITPAVMNLAGELNDDAIYATLAQIMAGQKPGRSDDNERIHFAHMGMGVEDVALGWDIYCRASRLGIGQKLRLWDAPLWS
jgi:N-[(2S)-2-amino-2-carboxyethyl]-L-glutamate dehydrogenase